ncbi:serine hydrolase [Hymenobacter sp. BT186]|uniref:Serine hydrolase n=1 Tax=Hymenobacter telluris TaxID=2816474 RepID=A0A939EYI9_9BACT|nr:serine hydrolase [Hymenobacter telluris]MBO0359808.1 serine hydrolase [Hymenobacter telluris]MBW3375835.1 class A beta-lactamase-related serine hydrolase [Hymenobacter norwichensis]
MSLSAALLPLVSIGQPSQTVRISNSPLLDSLLRSDKRLAPVVSQARKYELQIIYTQITRDVSNQPHFIQHDFQLDAHQYFNPASLVKLPVAALALEKLNRLHLPGLTRRSPMVTHTAFRCQTAAPYNPAADSDRVNTVGNYIKRMLLVSDNSAYNRLYEFLGQRPLNERLAQLGYPSSRITRRFAPCDTTANRHTNPIDFLNTSGQLVYQQPAAFNAVALTSPLGRITKGRAYQAGGRIIPRPYDFTTANYLPLQSITDILKAVLFPEVTPASQQFDLSPDDYAFLRYYLHHTPHSSSYSPYNSKQFFDAYKKYLYYGRSPQTPTDSTMRIYNIVGMSHGYLADVAYFVDLSQQTEFLLSAVLYVNQDGVINDGVYEYNSIGLPFLANLGQAIQQYEASRNHSQPNNPSAAFPPEIIR